MFHNSSTYLLIGISILFILVILYQLSTFNSSLPQDSKSNSGFKWNSLKPTFQGKLSSFTNEIQSFLNDTKSNELRIVCLFPLSVQKTIVMEYTYQLFEFIQSLNFQSFKEYESPAYIPFTLGCYNNKTKYEVSFYEKNTNLNYDTIDIHQDTLNDFIQEQFDLIDSNDLYISTFVLSIESLNSTNSLKTSIPLDFNDVKETISNEFESINKPISNEYESKDKPFHIESSTLPSINYNHSTIIKKKCKPIEGVSEHYNYEKDGYKLNTTTNSYIR